LPSGWHLEDDPHQDGARHRSSHLPANTTATSFATVEPQVRALLAELPDLPAVVLAERVSWSGSISGFRQNVARLRPQFRPIDPADRLTWSAGDAAQCDLWVPPFKIPLEDGSTKLLPVLVITAAHSRYMLATMPRHARPRTSCRWGNGVSGVRSPLRWWHVARRMSDLS
jgi:hypothetical protein